MSAYALVANLLVLVAFWTAPFFSYDSSTLQPPILYFSI